MRTQACTSLTPVGKVAQASAALAQERAAMMSVSDYKVAARAPLPP
jgi:hypothetical protein